MGGAEVRDIEISEVRDMSVEFLLDCFHVLYEGRRWHGSAEVGWGEVRVGSEGGLCEGARGSSLPSCTHTFILTGALGNSTLPTPPLPIAIPAENVMIGRGKKETSFLINDLLLT